MSQDQAPGKFFDGYAQDFEAIYGGERRGALGRVLDRLFRRSMLLRFQRSIACCDPIEGKTVVDIGCGPGHYSVALAERGAARVVGIDLAPQMLTLAIERAAAAGVADRCEFIAQDLMAYQVDEPFDYAVVMGVMDYVADPPPFVRRVLELTRRRACFSFPEDRGLMAAYRRYRYRKRTPLYLFSREAVSQIFDQASPGQHQIDKLARDYFVTVDLP